LQSGEVGQFSPVSGLSQVATASLAKIGKVAFLFAPNGYHNGGLIEETHQLMLEVRQIADRPCPSASCTGCLQQ